MGALHTGKLDARVETSLTEAMSDLLGARAHALGVTKADLLRELVYLAATGETFSFHVAKDKDAAVRSLLADVRDVSRSDRSVL